MLQHSITVLDRPTTPCLFSKLKCQKFPLYNHLTSSRRSWFVVHWRCPTYSREGQTVIKAKRLLYDQPSDQSVPSSLPGITRPPALVVVVLAALRPARMATASARLATYAYISANHLVSLHEQLERDALPHNAGPRLSPFSLQLDHLHGEISLVDEHSSQSRQSNE